MRRVHLLVFAIVAVGCGSGSKVANGRASPVADGGADAPVEAAAEAEAGTVPDAAPQDAAGDAAPATCDGYEPCGVHPVVVPAGYKLQPSVTTNNLAQQSSCSVFRDCAMWNTHFTKNFLDFNGNPVDPYYNRMGSPFPWGGSRYEFVVAPMRITYVKFHVMAPGELYTYSDGTPEERIDRTTLKTTCFKRGPGHTKQLLINNMGGTGNVGFVDWNISVLPGDMGNSGNASTCSGSGATTSLYVTSDPSVASKKSATGKYFYCLLREGHDYYLDMMSHGAYLKIDCSKRDCDFGGFEVSNFTGSDGSSNPVVEVPCP